MKPTEPIFLYLFVHEILYRLAGVAATSARYYTLAGPTVYIYHVLWLLGVYLKTMIFVIYDEYMAVVDDRLNWLMLCTTSHTSIHLHNTNEHSPNIGYRSV